MTGYVQINIKNMVDTLGEDRAKSILSTFSCPLNKDVEEFLKTKAIEFSKQDIARTVLVLASYKKDYVIVGYYTICHKSFNINPNVLSSNLKKRTKKFAQYIKEIGKYQIVAPLIAQLGKNYYNKYNKLITGDELLKMACEKIREYSTT